MPRARRPHRRDRPCCNRARTCWRCTASTIPPRTPTSSSFPNCRRSAPPSTSGRRATSRPPRRGNSTPSPATRASRPAPLFSHPSATFTSDFSLTLSSPAPGAVIRYTTNGSDPTETSGTVYSAPITVNNSTRVRARVFQAGPRARPGRHPPVREARPVGACRSARTCRSSSSTPSVSCIAEDWLTEIAHQRHRHDGRPGHDHRRARLRRAPQGSGSAAPARAASRRSSSPSRPGTTTGRTATSPSSTCRRSPTGSSTRRTRKSR